MVNNYEFNKLLRTKTDALLKMFLYNESIYELDEKKIIYNVVNKYIGKPIIIKLKVQHIIDKVKQNYMIPNPFIYTTLNGTLKLLLLEYDQVWLKNTINEYCNNNKTLKLLLEEYDQVWLKNTINDYCNNIKRNFISVIQKLEITKSNY